MAKVVLWVYVQHRVHLFNTGASREFPSTEWSSAQCLYIIDVLILTYTWPLLLLRCRAGPGGAHVTHFRISFSLSLSQILFLFLLCLCTLLLLIPTSNLAFHLALFSLVLYFNMMIRGSISFVTLSKPIPLILNRSHSRTTKGADDLLKAAFNPATHVIKEK